MRSCQVHRLSRTSLFVWIGLLGGLLSSRALGAEYAGQSLYTSFEGRSYTMHVWQGSNVALLTPTSLQPAPDSATLLRIVDVLDAAYDYYLLATGRKPISYAPTTVNGRATIAVVESTCGAGCGYLGFTGIELQTTYFQTLHDGVRHNDQYDQVVFYELGRNFWHYDAQLARDRGALGSTFATGYAVFMRFKSMEAVGVNGAPFRSWTFAQFRSRVEGLVDLYETNPSLHFNNTLAAGQGVPGSTLGATDLFASMLFRLGRDYGGDEFFLNIWKEVGRRPAQSSDQQASDNFFVAACKAARRNLTALFANRWKWPVSEQARRIAASLGPETPGDQNTTLFIENSVAGYTQAQTGIWTLTYVAGASDDKDLDDVVYGRPDVSANSKIVSVVQERGSPASRRRPQNAQLQVDARPEDSAVDIDLEISVESGSGLPLHFPSPVENKLVFRFPENTTDNFLGRPMTLWQHDPLRPNARYPVWDIRAVIEKNAAALALPDLTGYHDSGIPYSYWVLSTGRQPGDITRDGNVDVNDYRLVEAALGFEGATDADVAGARGLGLPDGAVDMLDLYHLYNAMAPEDAARIEPKPQPPYLVGDFENGFDTVAWTFSGWPYWDVTSAQSRSGRCSARAGAIGDGESTSLSIGLECEAGQITFWRKVSCESGWDFLEFHIDGQRQGQWSGELDWEQVAFDVEAGAHTFTWTYRKDGSSSSGEDTAWIDDIAFPALAQ